MSVYATTTLGPGTISVDANTALIPSFVDGVTSLNQAIDLLADRLYAVMGPGEPSQDLGVVRPPASPFRETLDSLNMATSRILSIIGALEL